MKDEKNTVGKIEFMPIQGVWISPVVKDLERRIKELEKRLDKIEKKD